ncbi:hypothetical protein PoB_004774800 [Plakobranchus ocellatus]|uniref:Uncharacterized protein n=1 Tax=Plakobranchus ocellatus TaxID=259542 RepID=A0AAV4BQ51_9GAST|nr:hypothetical protein PoB_004774800 [Plakobranchus ocellatus]
MNQRAFLLGSLLLYGGEEVLFSHGRNISSDVTHDICAQAWAAAIEKGSGDYVAGDGHPDFVYLPLSYKHRSSVGITSYTHLWRFKFQF